MSTRHRVLTGITTSGTPHLGNYVGAIRPAIAASLRDEVESFYFLADYHALVKCQDPARVQRSTMEIAATWLALGLDPERVFFYRQSDIPEIPELTWLLSCVAAKGLLNRAHAYKASVDANLADDRDADAGISMGLFSYPVLMAADILLFNAHRVPVGRDQVQHIEMARDFAQRFNHLYAAHFDGGAPPFVLPDAQVDDAVSVLPGLDGRKMSKSYDNTVPLWLEAPALRKALLGIVTDSRAPGEPKDADTSNVFALYQAFASAEETSAMREAFVGGIGWGDAKRLLFERIDAELAPARERYRSLMHRPAEIEGILQAGAAKARGRATPFLRALRAAVGLRPLVQPQGAAVPKHPERFGQRAPEFKTFREADGQFRFRLIDGDGATLMTSVGFASARAAGERIAELRARAADLGLAGESVLLDGVAIGMRVAPAELGQIRRSVHEMSAA